MSDGALALTRTERRRSLAAVILHMTGIGLTMGVTIPLTSLVLERWETDTWLIGVVVGMPGVAIVALMPHMPRLIGRIGTLPSMYCGCALGVAAILLHPLFPSVIAWAVLRFLIGAGLALPWLVGETWINAIALESNRGRVVGVYGATLFAGFSLGPILLHQLGTEGWPPFLLAAGAMAGAVLPLLLAHGVAPPMPAHPALRLRDVVRATPTVAAAGLVAGMLEWAYYALLPLYTVRSGISQAFSLQILTVFLVGGIALQLPTGWVADRVERHRVLAGLGFASGVGAILLPFTIGIDWLLAVLVLLLGGVVLGFYTVGLALLGQRFRTTDLAVANAVFIILYETGSFTGPAIGGAAMDLWQPHGLILAIALVSTLFGALALRRSTRPLRPERLE